MNRGAMSGPLGLLLAGLFFVAAGAILVSIVAPDIRNDIHIRETARPTSGVRIVEARCRSRVLVFQDCRVTLARSGTGEVIRSAAYIFVGLPVGETTVRALGDPSRPDLVTTDFGLQRLTMRLLTIGGILVACFFLIGSAIMRVMRG